NCESATMNFLYISLTNGLVAPLAVHCTICGAIHETFVVDEQPQVELMLLTARLISLPTAHVDYSLCAPKRGGGLWQSPTRQQDPMVVRFRNRQEFASGVKFRPVLPRCRAENHIGLRVPRQKFHLPRDLIGQQIIIR